MKIPLSRLLKRRLHSDIAALQDEVVDAVYSVLPDAVLHGGTAVWRCHGGNRFSEDLDFYAMVPNDFEDKLRSELEKRALEISRFKRTENTVFCKVLGSGTEVRLEIALRGVPNREAATYERADGSSMSIYSLSAESLIAEKIGAYLDRRFVRDLYDIYFLTGKGGDFGGMAKECRRFAKEEKMPVDEKNLRALVYSGIAPPAKQMLETVLGRFGHEIH